MAKRKKSTSPHKTLAQANKYASRSSRAWLAGLGLLDGLQAVAHSAGDVPVPTPGVDQLREQLDDASRDAVRAADLILSVFNGESTLTPDELKRQLKRCRVRGKDTDAIVRASAQLALGVTSHANATDEVMLLERAAVMVLARASVRASRDSYQLRCSDEADLQVEVAGVLARILAETDLSAAWRGPEPDQWVEVVASADADLAVSFADEPTRRWPAPVTIAQPAGAIAARIAEWEQGRTEINLAVVAAPRRGFASR